jgi:hypothetical protein
MSGMTGKLRKDEGSPGQVVATALGAVAAGTLLALVPVGFGALLVWWLLPAATAGAFALPYPQVFSGLLVLRFAAAAAGLRGRGLGK